MGSDTYTTKLILQTNYPTNLVVYFKGKFYII